MKSQCEVAGLFEGKLSPSFRAPTRTAKPRALAGMKPPALLFKFCWTLLLLGGLVVGGGITWWEVQQLPPPRVVKELKGHPHPDEPAPGSTPGPTPGQTEPGDYRSLLATQERSAAGTRPPDPVPEQSTPLLEGKVFVLVLHTNTKKSKVGTAEFDKQLADLSAKHGKKLLEGSAHILTTKGVRKWAPGLKLSENEAFGNQKVGPLFAAAFEAITKTTARARNKDFKTVFVWETDFDPTGAANPNLTIPPGRELRLCYRFTDDRENDMREPANLRDWYGLADDKAKRIDDVGQLRAFVEDLGALDGP